MSIDKPIISNGNIVHESAEIIAISNQSVATSGNYRNFKEDSLGNRYAHIINPKTGRSATTDILSATVIANDCMSADAYATTLMVLGLDKAKNLLAKHPEIAAMLITSQNGKMSFWHSANYPKAEK